MTPAERSAGNLAEAKELLRAYVALTRIKSPSPNLRDIIRAIRDLIQESGYRIGVEENTGKPSLIPKAAHTIAE